jgi:hypothetical protein
MQEIGLEQPFSMRNNNGALLKANAQQPTRRTRYIDIKHFTLLDWVEQDMIILEGTPTNDNFADAMTKALTKTLFYRHYDTYMGLRKPDYCTTEQLTTHDDETSTILPTSAIYCSTLYLINGHAGGAMHPKTMLSAVSVSRQAAWRCTNTPFLFMIEK